jgi:hypothetical protein
MSNPIPRQTTRWEHAEGGGWGGAVGVVVNQKHGRLAVDGERARHPSVLRLEEAILGQRAAPMQERVLSPWRT